MPDLPNVTPSYFSRKRTDPAPVNEDVSFGDVLNLRRELRQKAQARFNKTYGKQPSDRK